MKIQDRLQGLCLTKFSTSSQFTIPTSQTQGPHPRSPRGQLKLHQRHLYFRQQGRRRDEEAEKRQQPLSSFLCDLDTFPSFNSPISMRQLTLSKIPGSYHVTLDIGQMTTRLPWSLSGLWPAKCPSESQGFYCCGKSRKGCWRTSHYLCHCYQHSSLLVWVDPSQATCFVF